MYRRNFPDDPGMHNMGGGHTRVTYRRNPGFFERIGNSLAGIVVGIAILFGASVLTFWNEGRAVQTAQSLDEGLANVISLSNIDVVFDNNNGKLVHLIGPLHTDRVLSDPTYNVVVHGVKLRRNVEMYQWVEHESKREYNEGSETRVETTYSYTQEWRSDLVRSQSFDDSLGHKNPTAMTVESTVYTADMVQVGQFHLSKGLVEKITDFKAVEPSFVTQPADPMIKIVDGVFYHSYNPHNPQIGDLRVKFEYAGLSGQSVLGSPDVVSIVARQVGSTLQSYQTLAGDALELLYAGSLSAQDIFTKEHSTNTMVTWGIRFGGWLLMLIGFSCLTSIITTLVDWIPLVRDLVAAGVGIMNLGFSISLSLTVIAIGWIRYRPLLGITILALAATPFIMSRIRRSQGSSARYH